MRVQQAEFSKDFKEVQPKPERKKNSRILKSFAAHKPRQVAVVPCLRGSHNGEKGVRREGFKIGSAQNSSGRSIRSYSYKKAAHSSAKADSKTEEFVSDLIVFRNKLPKLY